MQQYLGTMNSVWNAEPCVRTHNDNHFEYLLGGPEYKGLDMYIVWRLGRQEVRPDANNDAINASNKMHVGYINVWSAYQWPLLFPRFHHMVDGHIYIL